MIAMKNRTKELFIVLKIIFLIAAFVAVIFKPDESISFLLFYVIIDALKILIDENK